MFSLELDLHGKFQKEAEESVSALIKKAADEKIGRVKVITGRGNHPNSVGARGLLFKSLPKWLNHDPIKPFIMHVIKNVGSYDILLYKIHLPKNSSTHKLNYGSDEFFKKLMKAIEIPEADSKKHPLIQEIISKKPDVLEKTCTDGTTAFMVAASRNQVETMKLLLSEEKVNGIQPKLLKQARHDGTNALMVSIVHGQIESIDFLLKKAPSLLKRKNQEGFSVFSFVPQSGDPGKVLDILYSHLENHKREKGYTDLFREYKVLKKEISNKKKSDNEKVKIQIIESRKFKKYKAEHAWFFTDRMEQFIESVKNTSKLREETKKLIREMRQVNDETSKVKRRVFKFLLKRDNKIRRLFLSFNNSQKERMGKRNE